eukprot:636540-Prymnesium_polylepis.1
MAMRAAQATAVAAASEGGGVANCRQVIVCQIRLCSKTKIRAIPQDPARTKSSQVVVARFAQKSRLAPMASGDALLDCEELGVLGRG